MNQEVLIVDIDASLEYQRLLEFPGQTHSLKASKVCLAAGQFVGRHSTGKNEEILIFLSGKGRCLIGDDKKAFEVSAGQIAYIRPDTIHDIENSSAEPLVYVFATTPTD